MGGRGGLVFRGRDIIDIFRFKAIFIEITSFNDNGSSGRGESCKGE